MLRFYDAPSPSAATLVLAHGAGAGHEHPWMVRVATGLAARGIRVVTFNFPYREEGRKLPDPGAALEEAFGLAWETVALDKRGPLFAGGKSMGGRISSQLAARGGFVPPAEGLVFFGYPLHPPGKPGQRRDRHLPKITTPMLFVSGTRDPFGSPDELQALVATLPGSTLRLLEGGDHSLAGRTKRAGRTEVQSALLEQAIDIAAAWMKGRART
jgi:predicted alpha/beta-hydrolase family hydrolase